MAASDEGFDGAMDKAVDALLDSHGYGNAELTPCAEGVIVRAGKRIIRSPGTFRLVAKVGFNGEILEKEEVDL